jgi:CRP-like cAMP-binding protein
MAAMSLAHKVGYLTMNDLVGTEGDTQAAIERRLPKRLYKKGDTIFPARNSEPTLFIIKSGSVNLFRISVQGSRFEVNRLGPGAVFGEMAILGQSMLGAHAEAGEKTEVLTMNVGDLEAIAKTAPSVTVNVLRQIGPRLVEAERKHEQAAFQPVTSRIASLLLRHANKENQVVGFTHQQLADTLGVYRETVTNALAELKQDKLIKIGRKRLELIDLDGLRRLESF